MKRFVEGVDRGQSTLFPECLDDWIGEDNPVRVIDVFVDELDLAALGFSGVDPEATGRPSYHPAVLLKLYIYGYLNRVQSSRRLEREAGRNVEVMWLTGRLVPDHKTIADFRKTTAAPSARSAHASSSCAARCLSRPASRLAPVPRGNNRDRNFTRAKMARASSLGTSRATCAARHRRPAGALRGARDQDHPYGKTAKIPARCEAVPALRRGCSPHPTSRYR